MDGCAPLSVSDTTERTRGRTVRRRVEVYTAPTTGAPWQADWPALGRVVRVTRSGVRQGTPYQRSGLYVTSRTDDASALGATIRAHWHVENRLHSAAVGGGCKDALMKEDAGGVRSVRGASVLSALRGMALSVLRHGGAWSPTAARSRLSNRVPAMLALIRT